jgi:hypothetical protein
MDHDEEKEMGGPRRGQGYTLCERASENVFHILDLGRGMLGYETTQEIVAHRFSFFIMPGIR